jgi:hypothetical protein
MSEIWFRRVTQWRSLPCHWKGFTLLLGAIAFVQACAWAGLSLIGHSSFLAGVCFVLGAGSFVMFFVVARRGRTAH